MNARRNLFIGMLIGVLLCVLFYVSSSSILIEYSSFILGVLACFIFFFIIQLFKNKSKKISVETDSKESDSARKPLSFWWKMFSVLMIVVCLIGGSLIYEQNKKNENQLALEKEKVEQQSEMLKSIKQSNLFILMSDILKKVDEEIEEEPLGELSEETIERIVALNYSFSPYKSIHGDSLSTVILSPERGQLLLSLLSMNIDSSSFEKIILRTSFAYVDLNGANLRGVDLSEADLRGASFRDANLRGADLNGADLRDVDLWGAKLEESNLKNVKLNRAELSWANLYGGDLENAILNGANLTSTKLKNTNLKNAEVKWASLRGAFLNDSNLQGVNLYGTNLEKANLNNADLHKANLLYANLNETLFENAVLTETKLIIAGVAEENWLEKLNEWKVVGAKEIQEKYHLELDKAKRTKYHLKKN